MEKFVAKEIIRTIVRATTNVELTNQHDEFLAWLEVNDKQGAQLAARWVASLRDLGAYLRHRTGARDVGS